MQLDCPTIGIIHLYRLMTKVVYIDYFFKCPNYPAWKSYEDAMKLSIISFRKTWLSRQPTKRGFYMPHRVLIRETIPSAEIGLLRAGGKMAPIALSLGTPSGTKYTTSRFSIGFARWRSLLTWKIYSCKFALLEGKSGALWFHFLCDLHSTEIHILRFSMAPFCLAPSPFLLGGVILQHLQTSIPSLQWYVCVVDLVYGCPTLYKPSLMAFSAAYMVV